MRECIIYSLSELRFKFVDPEVKMCLNEELKQLNSYYDICNHIGKLVCASLIDGVNDILNGKDKTRDIYESTREELECRISEFYANIDEYLGI